ncbi:MAG: MBL fold metallo-hydrolase [Hyphomicrobiales bacterium]|nr:MBL fold metallo-hydrolase [Hyphomicrobiales bacterium]
MTTPASVEIPLDQAAPQAGLVETLSPRVRRLIAPNGGPFTFTGTCTYLVGARKLVVIDPGPDHGGHLASLMAAIGDAEVAAILVTHTHRDHAPLARALARATGAPVMGCGPHVAARALAVGETSTMEGSNDLAHQPQRILKDGDKIEVEDFDLVAIATPGHTMNHLAFALPQEGSVFSGDHVMAWSTSIVAPPDGAMGPYMASLAKMLAREDAVYWPGHGGGLREPQRFVRALIAHRRQRENSILAQVRQGTSSIPAIVAAIYTGLDPRLKGAAALSVYAHLEDLVAKGKVGCEGPPLPGASYHEL